jgi:hypothetical protein
MEMVDGRKGDTMSDVENARHEGAADQGNEYECSYRSSPRNHDDYEDENISNDHDNIGQDETDDDDNTFSCCFDGSTITSAMSSFRQRQEEMRATPVARALQNYDGRNNDDYEDEDISNDHDMDDLEAIIRNRQDETDDDDNTFNRCFDASTIASAMSSFRRRQEETRATPSARALQNYDGISCDTSAPYEKEPSPSSSSIPTAGSKT